MLRNEVILPFKGKNVFITGAEGIQCLERQKALEGLLTIFYELPGSLFLRVPPLGESPTKVY